MTRSVEYIDASRRVDVMEEQFDFLMEHYRRSRRDPGICAVNGPARVCPNCVRYVRLMNVLTAPFDTTKYAPRRALAA